MPAPTPPRHRGPSREVRLRRTLVGGIVLITMTSTLVAFARNPGTEEPTAAPKPAAAPKKAAPVDRILPKPVPGPDVTFRHSARGLAHDTPSSAAQDQDGAKKPAEGKSAKGANASNAAAPKTKVTVPDRGSGEFTTVRVPGHDSTTQGTVVTYRLQVEGGLHADKAAIAKTIGSVLRDPRGWQTVDHMRFVQADKGQSAQITIKVASPQTTDKLCLPAKTEGKWSCFNQGDAVLNYKRWMKAVPQFDGNLTGYRQYLVNHEVGHGLGHRHQTCPGKGDPAPVMQEQSMALHGCTAWFWPMSPKQAAKESGA